MLKNSFIAGLIIVAPIAFTYIVLKFVIDMITYPFIDLYNAVIEPCIPLNFVINNSWILAILKQIIILFFVLFSITFIGLVVRHLISPALKEIMQSLADRLPFINLIYNTAKQFVSIVFKKDSNAFKQVVMVPFYGEKNFAFGLISNYPNSLNTKSDGNLKVSVFIPTAPSPLSGFIIICNEKDVVHVDMTVDDLFKFIISLGLVVR